MASDRLYIPPRIGDSTLTDIISRRTGRPFSYIRRRRGGEVQVGSHIAINIGGACLDNGHPWARGASAVYFGPGSAYNISEEMDDDGRPHTNQRAEINAAIMALSRVRKLLNRERLTTNLVLLISNSRYLVNTMTDYIYGWQDNGWRSARGLKVANRWDFKVLDGMIDELEDDYDVFVKLWWVPKEDNEEVGRMAREAAGFDDDDSSSD